MERHIAYLLEDLRASHRPEEGPPAPLPFDEDRSWEEHIAEVERYISGGEAPCTLAESLGLDPAAFPPPARLSEGQMAEITQALREALFSYNICAELPDGLPARMSYPLVVGLLDERVHIDKHGVSYWNFCEAHPDPADCVFGPEFCTCKDLPVEDITAYPPPGTDELPF